MSGITGLTSTALMNAQRLVEMQQQMNDLSLQLSSGKLTQSYAGLGIDRGLDVNVRASMSRLDSYEDVITNVNTRVQLMTTSLEQIRSAQSDIRSATLQPDFTLVAGGQTNAQIQAQSALASALDALNQKAGDTYLFSGSATNTPATDTADHILNGNGTAAGLKQVIAERLQADQGSDGRGRLAAPTATGDSVTLSEQSNAGPFGFKLAGASTSITGATVTGPAGTPPSLSVNLNGNNPTDGQTVTVQLNLPDGTQKTITLTASSETPPPDGSFAIGATAADTAANLASALDSAILTAGQVELPAASAIAASNNFFDTDADHPAQRVDGPPFDTASALRDATDTDTVKWYTGDDGTNDPRSTMTARVDDAITVSYGVRGNEEAIRDAVKNFATFAAVTFSGSDSNAQARYYAFNSRIGANLAQNPNQQQIEAIETQIAGANVSANAAKTRIDAKKPILQGVLDDIENADPTEVGVKLLALQTQLQASLQTTALLSKLTLVNYMS